MARTKSPATKAKSAKKILLSAADHAAFVERGYLLVKGVVPPEKIEAALKALEKGQDEWNMKDRGQRREESPELAACVTEDFHRAVTELFGAGYAERRVSRFRDMPRPHEPAGDWPEPISHTDNDHPVIMPDSFALGAMIFLTKVIPRSGGLIVFPGSHRRYRALLARDAGTLRVRDGVVEEKGPWEEVLAEPGDALLWHHLLGHSTSNNVSNLQTRHVLLSWIHADARVFPGDKPFARMSTVEKANSARYCAHALGDRLADPAAAAPAALAPELAEGASFSRDVLACAVLRAGGVNRCLFVERAKPDVVRLATSPDGAAWRTEDALVLPNRDVRALHLHREGERTLLFAGDGSGTRVYSSADLKSWSEIAVLEGLRAAFGHVAIVERGGLEAGYDMVYAVPGARPGALVRRRGKEWAQAAAWAEEAVGETAGGQIADAVMEPIRGDNLFGFVLDARPRGKTETGMLFARSRRGLTFDAAPEPLPGPAGARGLRVYDRSRDYWLVTYLLRRGDGDRLFWGEIDWEKPAPRLTPIETPEALQRALGVVGLR